MSRGGRRETWRRDSGRWEIGRGRPGAGRSGAGTGTFGSWALLVVVSFVLVANWTSHLRDET